MRSIKVLLSVALMAVSLACSAQNYYKKGNKAADKGNHTEALRFYRLALEQDPEDTHLLFNIATTLYELKDYPGGITVATQAIGLDSTSAPAYFCRARCYGVLGNYASAISDYTVAIKLDPQEFSYFNRGLCKFHLEYWREAIDDFTIGLEKNPDEYLAYLYRGNCREELGEFDRALEDYAKAAALNKKDPDVFQDRAYLFYTMGRLQHAKTDYRTVLKLEPENVDANLAVAELCLITHEYDSAHQFAKAARKYAAEADDKVVSLIFSCIAGKLTDKDVSSDDLQLRQLLQRYLVTSWSFDEVRTFLSGAPIDAVTREYSLELIEQYEAQAELE